MIKNKYIIKKYIFKKNKNEKLQIILDFIYKKKKQKIKRNTL